MRSAHRQVEHAGDRNRARLENWFQQWHESIRAWLRRFPFLPDSELDDLAQEVFIRLLRYCDDVPVENPIGYLFRISTNVANDWHLPIRVRAPHGPSALKKLKVDSAHDPENVIDRARLTALVQAAINQLPPRQREVVMLRVLQNKKNERIATELGLTNRMVQRDLARAYMTLRAHLRFEDLS